MLATLTVGVEVNCFCRRVRSKVTNILIIQCVHVTVNCYYAKVKLIVFRGVLSPTFALARYQCLSPAPYSALQR